MCRWLCGSAIDSPHGFLDKIGRRIFRRQMSEHRQDFRDRGHSLLTNKRNHLGDVNIRCFGSLIQKQIDSPTILVG
jgi:hypothetical protein